jgi:hypothetical protein
MRTMVERVRNAGAQGTRWRASPNAHQGKNHRLQQFPEQSDELGQKNSPKEAPGMIFETQDRGQYPQMASLWKWIVSEYQSRPDRIVKTSRRWITFSPLEWITF